MTKTKILVEFSIIGDHFDPLVITNDLSVEPTGYYFKGEKGQWNTEKKETCWYISSEYVESLYVADVLKKIIDKIQNNRKKLNDLREQFDLTYKFFIDIKIEEKMIPAIYLDKEIIEFANDIKAELDFDIHIF
jgi:hypothetical protein